ncbi:MAG: hypothetical protein ACMXX9_00695 [Candidatus Woesearchaeota archaeon]
MVWQLLARAGADMRTRSAAIGSEEKIMSMLQSAKIAHSIASKRHESLEGDAKKASEDHLKELEQRVSRLQSQLSQSQQNNQANNQNSPQAPNNQSALRSKKLAVGAGAAIGAGLSWLLKKSDYNPEENNQGGGQILLALAILVHIIDFLYFGFRIDTITIMQRIFLYMLLSLAGLALIKMDKGVALKEFFFVSLFPLFIIPQIGRLFSMLPIDQVIISQLNVAFMFIPVWVLYLVFAKQINQGFLGRASLFYLAAMITIALFLMLNSFSGTIGEVGSAQGLDTDEVIGDGREYLSSALSAITDNIKNTYGAITGAVDARLNETLGRGYAAQVENTRERSGVFLDNLRPASTFYENQPIRVFADFQVRSYIDNVEVEFFCSLTDRNGREVMGTTTPPSINVSDFEDRRIFCDFEDMNISAGRFSARLDARFNFKTSAYSTYYFVPRSTLEEASRQTWNQRHRIPLRPTNIYTNGPVFLGMNESVTMPIPTFDDRDTFFALDFGIRNNQLRGEITRINNFETRVPEAISFEGNQCTIPLTRQGTDPDQNYVIYSYDFDSDINFLAVSCNAKINDRSVDQISSSGVRPVTIFAEVSYDYQLTSRTDINVLRLPGGSS